MDSITKTTFIDFHTFYPTHIFQNFFIVVKIKKVILQPSPGTYFCRMAGKWQWLLAGCMAGCMAAKAQSDINTGWLASFNSFKLGGKWSMHLDVQLRSTDNLEQMQTLLFRPGLNYHIRKNQVITLGYAYIPNRYYHTADNEMLDEQRIWQQYLLVQPAGHTSIQHRFRFEERFVPVPAVQNNELYAGDMLFSTRLRYFVRSVVPLKKQSAAFTKGIYFAPQNELFLNTTNQENVNGKTFDQNRLYGALGYRFAKSFDLEAGYMWQYVQRREGLSNINNHIAQIACYWRR